MFYLKLEWRKPDGDAI